MKKKCKWCGRIIHGSRRNYCSGKCYFHDVIEPLQKESECENYKQ